MTETSPQGLDHLVYARVASDGHPPAAAVPVEPALGRRADRVLEHPDLIEVTGLPIGDGGACIPPLATDREPLERPAPAAWAVQPQHQRVPAEPWSAIAWSRSNRSSEKAWIRSGVPPVAISSAIASPPAGIALKPHVPQPVVMTKPSTPVKPMIGEKSTQMCQVPAHRRRHSQ